MESNNTYNGTAAIVSEIGMRRIGMVALEILFAASIVTVSLWRNATLIPPTWMLPLFVLATFRLARTISFNEIGEVIREPFTEVKADSCGAGVNVHPKGSGIQYVIGSLIACPICTGTWSALALYAAWVVLPSLGTVLVCVLAFAGGSECLHWTGEFFEWSGRAARCVAGVVSPDQE